MLFPSRCQPDLASTAESVVDKLGVVFHIKDNRLPGKRIVVVS